ncbi:N-acetylmuramidase family protein [Moraxella marmotae]|uniref:N-acetylmuramidase family protein n=1 Tax=Moraxella marmotae TaxID=3344520 RepID=UPI0035D47D6C
MSKTITNEQIKQLALSYRIEYAALKAVIQVEAAGQGFLNGLPKILYEPHIMHRLLTKKGLISVREKMMREKPQLCYPRWGTHKYGLSSSQHGRLNQATNYDRQTALESCSWGLGQVMGFHWKTLGYESIQAFVNAMYKDEASQIDAMLRFIKANGLIGALQAHDWAKFAKGYNGSGYRKNNYHIKLAQAYQQFK